MLLRLSLIIAIIAALAVGVLNFVLVAKKIETVEQHRAEEQKLKGEALTELATTKTSLEKTTADLKQTKDTLATTTAERDKAVAEVAALSKKATDLAEKLAGTTKERDEARSDLGAFKATGLTPEQILSFNTKIKKMQESLEVALEEKKVLTRHAAKLQAKLDEIYKPDYFVVLPQELKGKVLATDPKWDFVVLDVGVDQGVLENGELLVNRNGKLVAKVRVTSVEKARCIANIVPGWKIGEVIEGDSVLPVQPPT